MSCPIGYVHECGPVALASLTGLELEEAAELLWNHRGLWWDPKRRVYPEGSGIYGTEENALADVILRLGYGVELWTGEGELYADPGICRQMIARLAHENALEVRRASPAPREPSADVCKAPAPISGPTLRTWLERHRGGGWWAVCVATEASAHVMPVWGSQILTDHEAELERYGDATVYRALRVFQPRGVTA